MTEDLIAAARACPRGKEALRALARRLPGDDDLAKILDEVAQARFDHAFTALTLGALDGGRQVDASILRMGAALLPDPGVLATLAGHLSEEVATHLLEAVLEGHMGWERQAVSLFLAAWWCKKEARELPEGLATEARVLARKPIGMEARFFLHATADLLDDEMVLGLMGNSEDPDLREYVRDLAADFSTISASPVLAAFEQQPTQMGSLGHTVRRSVEKTGRNAPCPCGSGAKYKKCCEAKDRERLRDSSDITGVTRTELRARPEPYLTRDRLRNMRSFELARIDSSLIEPDLLPLLVLRLDVFGEVQAIAEVFARVGWRDELDGHLLDAVETAVERGEHEIARRLISMRPAGAEADLGLAARAVIDDLEAGPMLEAFEAAARSSIDTGGDLEVAHALLSSSLPALGILVGRGAIATAHPLDAEVLLERILEWRDRLELDPDDPAQAVFDAMQVAWVPELDAHLSGPDESDIQVRRQELDAAQTEVRRLREEIRRLNEAASRVPPSSAVTTDTPDSQNGTGQNTTTDDSEVAEVRKRLSATKEELKQRHAERNALRRELALARREMRKLRTVETVATLASEEGDQEEILLLEEEIVEIQQVRLISHTRGFSDQLGAAARPVARATLRLAGRLAAGDLSGFRGSRRLRLDRTLWRQRVGISHRLLFRLLPQELELLALIDRRDLEKTIKRLAS